VVDSSAAIIIIVVVLVVIMLRECFLHRLCRRAVRPVRNFSPTVSHPNSISDAENSCYYIENGSSPAKIGESLASEITSSAPTELIKDVLLNYRPNRSILSLAAGPGSTSGD
jgi:hypothetical protein